MARKPTDMGAGLGGFDDLFPGSPDAAKGTSDVPFEDPRPAAGNRGEAVSPPADAGERTPIEPRASWGQGRTRNTRSFSITEATFDRMRRCAAEEGVTMSELAERALVRALDTLEERRGEPYPPVPKPKRGTAIDEL